MKFAQMIEVDRVSSTQFQLATPSLGEFLKLPGMRKSQQQFTYILDASITYRK